MTLDEAWAKGMRKLRLPFWPRQSHLELKAERDGQRDRYGLLHDAGSARSIPLFYAAGQCADWEEWAAP